jgi:hypothetical protein
MTWVSESCWRLWRLQGETSSAAVPVLDDGACCEILAAEVVERVRRVVLPQQERVHFASVPCLHVSEVQVQRVLSS